MEKGKATLQLSLKPSDQIKMALTEMACFRGAKVDTVTLAFYSKRLVQENLEDVLAALRTLQDLPREEGDLAFPEVGAILGMVGVCAVSRHNREQMGIRKDLVRWHCPECGIHMSGFISPLDREPRACKGIPREGSGICGAIMNEVHRERAA